MVDLGFCALAMYLLMPAQPGIDFVSLAVVFILATLLGFASHAPGSIGVFDAAMLVALPQFGREQLLATLVVFRILYFLIPFGISISIMGFRELWLSVVQPWLERRRLNELNEASSAVRQPVPSGRRGGKSNFTHIAPPSSPRLAADRCFERIRPRIPPARRCPASAATHGQRRSPRAGAAAKP